MGKSARKAKVLRAKASRQKLTIWIVVGCVALVFGIKYFNKVNVSGIIGYCTIDCIIIRSQYELLRNIIYSTPCA